MKVRVLILISLLIMGLALVSAQDGDMFRADDQGLITMPILSGTLTANDDNTYSLTIDSLPALTTIIVNNPELGIATGNFPTARLLTDFANRAPNLADDNALTIPGRITLANAALDVVVSNPQLDFDNAMNTGDDDPYVIQAQNVVFTVVLNSATNLSNGKELVASEIAQEITNGSLTLNMDQALLEAFNNNHVANFGRLGGIDTGCVPCGR